MVSVGVVEHRYPRGKYMMTYGNGADILKRLTEAGALKRGHFSYRNGMHGSVCLRPAVALQNPQFVEFFGNRMYQMWDDCKMPNVVVASSIGSILLANAVARWFPDCRSIYVDRCEYGVLALNHGFEVESYDRVLIVGDVSVTGSGLKCVYDFMRSKDTEIIGATVLVDRSGGEVENMLSPITFRPLSRLVMESWFPENCVLCRKGIVLEEKVVDYL